MKPLKGVYGLRKNSLQTAFMELPCAPFIAQFHRAMSGSEPRRVARVPGNNDEFPTK